MLVSLVTPLGVAAWSADVALETVRRGSGSAADAEQLLVGLAAGLCALACVHLFLLVAAGVAEGLRCARHPGSPPAAASGRLPGRTVRVAVAALVIGTTAVPTAHAGTPGTRPPAATAAVDAAPAPGDRPGGEARPGTWAALAEQAAPPQQVRPPGFVPAPTPPAPSTADLVTAPPVRTTVQEAAEPVVVMAGSSLWSIAAEHLGPGATDTEIAESWPRWWEVNRDVIGDDPHLLLPGQRLVPPSGTGS